MRKRKVLLLSEGFGTGHTRAAEALAAHLRQEDGLIAPTVLELGASLHPTLAPVVFKCFRRTIMKHPHLYGRMYRQCYDKSLSRLQCLALHRLFYAQTATLIRQHEPQVIVSTHPFPSAVIARLKRNGLSVPFCTVITDYDAHGAWIHTATDAYMVPTHKVKDSLIRKGAAASSIEVTGMPVHPAFSNTQDKALIRKQFGLRDMPTVLIMGGGWGLLGSRELLDQLLKWADRLQLVFVLGSNRCSFDQLRTDPGFQHPNIHLFGYLEEIPHMMEAADILVTKPGGMTCSEAFAKGLPMLLSQPLPGQEEGNSEHFVATGCAELIQSVDTLNRRFTELAAYAGNHYTARSQMLPLLHDPARCAKAVLRLTRLYPELGSLLASTSTR